MTELTRPGDIIAAQATIRALSDKLTEATKNVGNWMVEFEVEVSGDLGIQIRAKKQNGQGFIKDIDLQTVLYYANDVDTIVEKVTDDVFEYLLKNQIKYALDIPVKRAVQNFKAIKDKR